MKFIFVLGGVLFINHITVSVFAQDLTLDQIKTSLLNNPPNSGDPEIRKQMLLALDDILLPASSRSSQDVFDFYVSMMDKVNNEIAENVQEGVNIWMMYNHGFIVKTPRIVFAFDLVSGYIDGWKRGRQYRLPDELLKQIQILFISHGHSDHEDGSVISVVKNNGGHVIWGSAGDNYSILGLNVKVYFGCHSVVNRIYEVTTRSGLKIVHTGDNNSIGCMPVNIDSVDVLLLNAWIHQYMNSPSDPGIGMRTFIYEFKPNVMIPGHFHELGHDYVPDYGKSAKPYAWGLAVDDGTIDAYVQVMTWGEKYFTDGKRVTVPENTLPEFYKLHQNYPNPTKSATTISIELPKQTGVKITLYDILGKEIDIVTDREYEAGNHNVQYITKGLKSGIYFYKLEAGHYVGVMKLIVLNKL